MDERELLKQHSLHVDNSDSEEGEADCPLCMEEMDLTDKYFKPCPCGYQICRFCWNYINKDLNGLCPACRRAYSEDTVEFKTVSPEELIRIKSAKKRKTREKKEQEVMNRKQLANVRVVQKNLVYVLGLSVKVASEDVLRQHDYFGQYGKITKVVINRRTNTNGPTPVISNGVYITFAKKDDAAKAIEAVDGSVCDGRIIRATFGTTKYCSFFLKNQPCQNPGCQYLHEPGEEADTFLKEESLKQRPITAKAVPFPPVPSSRATDKEESALPATASWAKPAKQISHYVGVTAGSSISLDSSLPEDAINEQPPVPAPPVPEEQPIPQPPPVASSPKPNKKKSKQNVTKKEKLQSPNPPPAALVEPVLQQEPQSSKPVFLHEYGYTHTLKYHGFLDPFNDKFDAEHLGVSESFLEGRIALLNAFVNDKSTIGSGSVGMMDERKKSRYEKIFGAEMEVLDNKEAWNANTNLVDPMAALRIQSKPPRQQPTQFASARILPTTYPQQQQPAYGVPQSWSTTNESIYKPSTSSFTSPTTTSRWSFEYPSRWLGNSTRGFFHGEEVVKDGNNGIGIEHHNHNTTSNGSGTKSYTNTIFGVIGEGKSCGIVESFEGLSVVENKENFTDFPKLESSSSSSSVVKKGKGSPAQKFGIKKEEVVPVKKEKLVAQKEKEVIPVVAKKQKEVAPVVATKRGVSPVVATKKIEPVLVSVPVEKSSSTRRVLTITSSNSTSTTLNKSKGKLVPSAPGEKVEKPVAEIKKPKQVLTPSTSVIEETPAVSQRMKKKLKPVDSPVVVSQPSNSGSKIKKKKKKKSKSSPSCEDITPLPSSPAPSTVPLLQPIPESSSENVLDNVRKRLNDFMKMEQFTPTRSDCPCKPSGQRCDECKNIARSNLAKAKKSLDAAGIEINSANVDNLLNAITMKEGIDTRKFFDDAFKSLMIKKDVKTQDKVRSSSKITIKTDEAGFLKRLDCAAELYETMNRSKFIKKAHGDGFDEMDADSVVDSEFFGVGFMEYQKEDLEFRNQYLERKRTAILNRPTKKPKRRLPLGKPINMPSANSACLMALESKPTIDSFLSNSSDTCSSCSSNSDEEGIEQLLDTIRGIIVEAKAPDITLDDLPKLVVEEVKDNKPSGTKIFDFDSIVSPSYEREIIVKVSESHEKRRIKKKKMWSLDDPSPSSSSFLGSSPLPVLPNEGIEEVNDEMDEEMIGSKQRRIWFRNVFDMTVLEREVEQSKVLERNLERRLEILKEANDRENLKEFLMRRSNRDDDEYDEEDLPTMMRHNSNDHNKTMQDL